MSTEQENSNSPRRPVSRPVNRIKEASQKRTLANEQTTPEPEEYGDVLQELRFGTFGDSPWQDGPEGPWRDNSPYTETLTAAYVNALEAAMLRDGKDAPQGELCSLHTKDNPCYHCSTVTG